MSRRPNPKSQNTLTTNEIVDMNENTKLTKEADDGEDQDINKNGLTEEVCRKTYKFENKEDKSLGQILLSKCSCKVNSFILNLIPILQWLPGYKVNENLISDLIAGITVAVIQIPQGLAYALLAGTAPVVGINTAIFPVFIYVLMGTSRHISTGPFAVLCMMIADTITKYSHNDDNNNTTSAYTDTDVATAISLTIGLWQTLLGILKLGSLAVLFSETLVSGFTTGVAIHVFTSQVKSLLGVCIKRHSGPLKIIFMYIDIFTNISQANWITCVMSASFIIVLLIFNELIKPAIHKKCIVPVPIELLTIVAGGLISYFLNLKQEGVKVVGHVPTGLPIPSPPPIQLIPKIYLDCFVFSVVAIAMNVSLCKLFARRYGYEVRGNQELLAYGFGNIFGSFMSCFPSASSLSRTSILVSAGGKTQLANAISCVLLIFVLLFAGPLFDPLPQCVLSCIVVVALKTMLLQVRDFPKIYRLSKIDGLIWITTFLSVVFLDIDYGLFVGVGVTLLTMIIRGQKSHIVEMGKVPDTNIYLDCDAYKSAVRLKNVVILRLQGPFNFANCDTIRNNILKHKLSLTEDISGGNKGGFIILDFIGVSFIDPSGVKTLLSVRDELNTNNINLLICNCNVDLYKTLKVCHFFDKFPSRDVFSSLQSVVEYLDRSAGKKL